jgi:hypothetical protein
VGKVTLRFRVARHIRLLNSAADMGHAHPEQVTIQPCRYASSALLTRLLTVALVLLDSG